MDQELNLTDIIKRVLQHKLQRYISGKVGSEILRTHSKLGNKKIKEEAPTNAMGTSSSISGTGNIDTFDPLIKTKIARRKTPNKVEI